jgi:ketosteroid isomerase-like protein
MTANSRLTSAGRAESTAQLVNAQERAASKSSAVTTAARNFMSAEEEVLQASEQFYAALDRFLDGDAEPMMEVWSHGPDVTAMHSAPGRQVGWEEVRAAWEQFASLTSGGQVTVHDLLVRVGSDLAYTIGTERIEATLAGERGQFEGRVTNIYRREAGGWKMVHHHIDLSPQVQDIVSRLQTASG